ncbi:hypothetical protein PoB_000124600 [Plakobranchus ocellatus]|uniref:Uncharacterized protein n=1 Tax=Plakobranchus ocellatus TaxID=259542 RepID=A0AAV3XXD3_9GAST|nr:hypothetical protein PoB_000124600 [Plakobranchus ocellatus]
MNRQVDLQADPEVDRPVVRQEDRQYGNCGAASGPAPKCLSFVAHPQLNDLSLRRQKELVHNFYTRLNPPQPRPALLFYTDSSYIIQEINSM